MYSPYRPGADTASVNAAPNIIHPSLAAKAREAAALAFHRGVSVVKPGQLACAAHENGAMLTLSVGAPPRQLIDRARFDGATDPLLIGILETFCRVIEGLPLREAADHGTIHALERLCDNRPTKAAAGILTPRSAGSGFILCDRLVRRILAEHGGSESRSTANFWNPPLSAGWQAQSAAQRTATLEGVIGAFRTACRLNPSDFYLTSIDRNIRVFVGFGPGIRPDDKPRLLREFERQIRQATQSRLEVYVEDMKDDNVIRRL